MGRLEGKVALISGGARGQGAAEAKLFAAEGAKVMIGDVLDAEGEVTAKGLGDVCAYQHLDVTDEDDWAAIVAATIERYGRIDALVNNAGIFRLTMLATTTLDEYRQVIDINQVGVFLGMRAVTPVMSGQRSGSIVNISSIAGLRGTAGSIAYTASKFAVRGMTKVAALELAAVGIRANSIHPGIIDTPMFEEIAGMGVGDILKDKIPIGRIAEADDVAKLALFLASDDSAYCTGAEFVVDGGMTATF